MSAKENNANHTKNFFFWKNYLLFMKDQQKRKKHIEGNE